MRNLIVFILFLSACMAANAQAGDYQLVSSVAVYGTTGQPQAVGLAHYCEGELSPKFHLKATNTSQTPVLLELAGLDLAKQKNVGELFDGSLSNITLAQVNGQTIQLIDGANNVTGVRFYVPADSTVDVYISLKMDAHGAILADGQTVNQLGADLRYYWQSTAPGTVATPHETLYAVTPPVISQACLETADTAKYAVHGSLVYAQIPVMTIDDDNPIARCSFFMTSELDRSQWYVEDSLFYRSDLISDSSGGTLISSLQSGLVPRLNYWYDSVYIVPYVQYAGATGFHTGTPIKVPFNFIGGLFANFTPNGQVYQTGDSLSVQFLPEAFTATSENITVTAVLVQAFNPSVQYHADTASLSDFAAGFTWRFAIPDTITTPATYLLHIKVMGNMNYFTGSTSDAVFGPFTYVMGWHDNTFIVGNSTTNTAELLADMQVKINNVNGETVEVVNNSGDEVKCQLIGMSGKVVDSGLLPSHARHSYPTGQEEGVFVVKTTNQTTGQTAAQIVQLR